MGALDRSISLDMLFSAPHQYMHIYGGSKNDMKTANAVHYTYIYIVVYIIFNKLYLVCCIHGLYCNWIIKRPWFHLTIRASPAYIWCMSCNRANGSENNLMTINDVRAQYVCLNIETAVSICEECICVWAMGNARNYYLTINEININCVRHWHIIQYAILDCKLFVYSVYIIFHIKSNDSYNIPIVLVSVRTQRGWSDYMLPFFLPSDLPVLLIFPTKISFTNKQTNFARF